MQSIVTRFIILTKAYIKRLSFIISVIGLFFCIIFIGLYALKYNKTNKAGIIVDYEDTFNRNLTSELIKTDLFIEYQEREILDRDISNNILDCGFVLNSNVYNCEIDDINKYKVEYISSDFDSEKEYYKELFFKEFLNLYNDILIEEISPEILTDTSIETVENIINKKNEYIGSDNIFKINVIPFDEISSKDNNIDYTRSILAIYVFLSIILAGHSIYNNENILKALSIKQKEIYKLLVLLSAGVPSGLIALLIQLVIHNFNIIDCFMLPAFILYSTIWTYLLHKLIQSGKLYYQFTICLIPVILIVCPVIINMGIYIKAFNILKYIFPISLYL